MKLFKRKKKQLRRSDQTIGDWKYQRWVEWYWFPIAIGPTKHHNAKCAVFAIRWLCFQWTKSTTWDERLKHYTEEYEPNYGPSRSSLLVFFLVLVGLIYLIF